MTAIILALMLTASTIYASGAATTTADSRWQSSRQVRLRLKTQMPLRQWRCLYRLWANESGWRVHAGSIHKAYGIPQAYPGYRMRSAGKDWRTNAATQVRWGRSYIRHRYGSSCAALRFQDRHGWY